MKLSQMTGWRSSIPAALGFVLAAGLSATLGPYAVANDKMDRIDLRYASSDVDETPDFQRHVMPLFGRLGCNGRACHGSFQGRGGFRLSLFGYDFKSDYDALFDEESPRVDRENPDESLIIFKPTNEDEHEGGERYSKDSWQYNVLHRWIESGATYDPKQVHKLARLEIFPSEIRFHRADETQKLRVTAVWEDGLSEDVTPLCRFRTNDDEIAKIDENGTVTSAKPGDTHVVVFYDIAVQPVPVLQPVSAEVAAHYPDVPTPTPIDGLVAAKWKKLGIVPSDVCEDAEFLRRVSLDLTGTLPAPDEVETFLADERSDKRARKINQLLESEAYSAWWTTQMCDYTGNNDTQLVNVVPGRNGQASQDWYDWIYRRVTDNVPYDDLVAGVLTAQSRQPGQSYGDYCREMSGLYRKGSDEDFGELDSLPYYWARRDFRQPEARAIGVAYAFLGLRIQCAQCHKHPFDQWTKSDFASFESFFSSVVASNRVRREDQAEYNKMIKSLGLKGKRGGDLRREIQKLLAQGKTVPFPEVYVNNSANRAGSSNQGKGKGKGKGKGDANGRMAKLPGGRMVNLSEYEDPRDALMDWMRASDNPYFARAFVNRVWANYFGIGIVNPPDDLSLANPPSNAPLLDYLARSFVEHNFDMKWLHREITNSRTYQLSWRTNETNASDRRNFSHALPRRLPAEVLYDAVRQATVSDERMAETHASLENRAIAVPGTGARGGRGSSLNYALTVFGRSSRESNCDCDRSSDPSLLQTLYLQNDRDIQTALARKDGWIADVARQTRESISEKPARPANYEKLVRGMQSRIRQLRKSGKTAQVNQLQKRLAQTTKRYGLPGPERDQPAKAAKVDTAELISQAYLRTLSRPPSATELSSTRAYVADASTTSAGMRDVLWALLNTKEFIVNH